MTDDRILLDMRDGVATVILNRPQARNALDTDLLRRLQDCLRALAASNEVRACIFTGAGAAFCAGADLKQRLGMTAPELAAHTESILLCSNLLEQLPVPAIAAVNGPAYAGGLELAVACDIRIASEAATFALPEVKLGIFPGAGGPIRLPRIVGSGWARLMVFGGEPITSEEALRIGLVERVVPSERLMEETAALATRIARNSSSGVRAAKALMNATGEMSYASAVVLSNSLRHPLNGTQESNEGLRQFGRGGA